MAAVDLFLALALPAAILPAGAALADFLAEDVPAHERCALCHGLFGASPRDKFPRLAGQRPAYLESQIRAFLEGRRTNDGGQMAGVVTELASEDIPEVVAWFAGQPPPPPLEVEDDGTGFLAWLAAGCGDCHEGAGGPAMPHLTAQHPRYLAKQMRDIRDGQRPGDATGVMLRQLATLAEEEIDAIANWLAAQERPR